MKLMQAMKNLFHKMFAWWPWKQSTQIEHSHYANSINKGTTQGTLQTSMTDGIVHQTGIAPRLSTIQDWPESVVQTDLTAKSELTEIPLPASPGDGEFVKKSPSPAGEPPAGVLTSPSTQQRLEFLQYLIQRGIVNEGVEENK